MHTMSEGTQEAAGLSELACVLCGQVDEDSSILGHKHEENGLCFHTFCAIFSTGLCKPGKDNGNTCHFEEELIRAIRQGEQTHCYVCGKRGASITCAEPDCDRSFHLSCASEGECVTQFFEDFRCFCWVHRPHQAVEAVPAQDTTCIVCMDPVGDSMSYSTMVCPACKHAWFHRACIQEQAVSAGIYCFQCPLCRDRDWFIMDMLFTGIRIPFRKPTWEDNYAYASLGVRHQRCDARYCHHPRGRERAEGEGPWQLLLCSSCAAQGTHRLCSNLSPSTSEWECNTCAGEGTASSTNSDSAGPTTTSQQGPGPSQGPIGRESSSSGTTNQAPSGPDPSSQVPELLSRQAGRARTRSRSPLTRRAAENNSQPRRRRRRRRSRSWRRGPARGRSRSRVPRRALNFNRRPH